MASRTRPSEPAPSEQGRGIAEPSAAVETPARVARWSMQLCIGNFVQTAPFASEEDARAAYRDLVQAWSDYRPYANDGTALFRMKTMLGDVALSLATMTSVAIIDLAEADDLKVARNGSAEGVAAGSVGEAEAPGGQQ